MHCIFRPRKEIRRISASPSSCLASLLQHSSLYTLSSRQLFCSSVKVTVISFANDKRFELVDRDERNTTLCVVSTTHWISFHRPDIILSSDAVEPWQFVVSLNTRAVNKKACLITCVLHSLFQLCLSKAPPSTLNDFVS